MRNRIGSRGLALSVGCTLALVAGCASSGLRAAVPAPSPSASVGSPAAMPVPSPLTSKQQADGVARRLLALAAVPPGAVEVSAEPSSLAGPALGLAQESTIVDHARFWHVGLPLAAALAWVKAHPPAGFKAAGTMSSSDHGTPTAGGVSFTETGAQSRGQLEVGVAADGTDASDIRVDAVVSWLDPTPRADQSTGKRLHVTAAAGCPSSDKGFSSVHNDVPGLDKVLLPKGKPIGGLACVYNGMNAGSGAGAFGLVSHVILDAARAGTLASAVEAISLAHPDNEVVSCPMDDLAAAVLVFSYADGPDIDLWYKRNGCQGLSNGVIGASPYSGPFITVFQSLTASASP